MPAQILVTGGTGALGRCLVPEFAREGRVVRVLSRELRPAADGVEYVVGDLETGAGLTDAVAGVGVVVHAAGSAQRDAAKAANLVSALANVGDARHLVYISVVGADTTPFESRIDRSTLGYFEQKRLAELAIQSCGIPFTILRATQFHTFIAAYAELGLKLPIVPSFAGFRYQPVDARDVAERLAELALAEPAGLVADIAGPTIYPMEELLRGYFRAIDRHRAVVPLRVPGAAARAQRDGANLSPARAVGVRTWEQFLQERFGPRQSRR